LAETKPESMKEGKGNDKIGIQTIVRYGVQIVTDIGITGTRKIRFLDKKLISEGRNKVLQVDIENIGERWLSPFVWVELYNEEGTLLQRLESGRQRIYPGCSVRHKLDFTKVPRGKYKALVIADNEAETVFGAQYDVQVE